MELLFFIHEFYTECWKVFVHNSAWSTPRTLILEWFERGDSHDSNDIKISSGGVDHAELRMFFAEQSTSEIMSVVDIYVPLLSILRRQIIKFILKCRRKKYDISR